VEFGKCLDGPNCNNCNTTLNFNFFRAFLFSFFVLSLANILMQDLGNCLDYTKVPKNNLHPDVTNYNRLAEMYGTPIRRNLRRRSHAASTNVQVPSIPPQVHLEYKNAIAEFYQQHQHHRHQPTPAANSNSSTVEPQQQWRLLESHARGKKYRRLLGDTGFELEVHMLLAHPPE